MKIRVSVFLGLLILSLPAQSATGPHTLPHASRPLRDIIQGKALDPKRFSELPKQERQWLETLNSTSLDTAGFSTYQKEVKAREEAKSALIHANKLHVDTELALLDMITQLQSVTAKNIAREIIFERLKRGALSPQAELKVLDWLKGPHANLAVLTLSSWLVSARENDAIPLRRATQLALVDLLSSLQAEAYADKPGYHAFRILDRVRLHPLAQEKLVDLLENKELRRWVARLLLKQALDLSTLTQNKLIELLRKDIRVNSPHIPRHQYGPAGVTNPAEVILVRMAQQNGIAPSIQVRLIKEFLFSEDKIKRTQGLNISRGIYFSSKANKAMTRAYNLANSAIQEELRDFVIRKLEERFHSFRPLQDIIQGKALDPKPFAELPQHIKQWLWLDTINSSIVNRGQRVSESVLKTTREAQQALISADRLPYEAELALLEMMTKTPYSAKNTAREIIFERLKRGVLSPQAELKVLDWLKGPHANLAVLTLSSWPISARENDAIPLRRATQLALVDLLSSLQAEAYADKPGYHAFRILQRVRLHPLAQEKLVGLLENKELKGRLVRLLLKGEQVLDLSYPVQDQLIEILRKDIKINNMFVLPHIPNYQYGPAGVTNPAEVILARMAQQNGIAPSIQVRLIKEFLFSEDKVKRSQGENIGQYIYWTPTADKAIRGAYDLADSEIQAELKDFMDNRKLRDSSSPPRVNRCAVAFL